MNALRRAYRRRFGHHGRFNLAVVLTIVFVAWVIVPAVARFVNAWAGYAPVAYEPKDLERQTWLERRTADALLGRFEWTDFVGVALFVVVAAVWLTLVPDRAPRRRLPQ